MDKVLFVSAGYTAALSYALKFLKERGCGFADSTNANVTHLLLPVPSYDEEGYIKGGGQLLELLSKLPTDITVIGGNLRSPELKEYRKIDLLQDELYLAHNANITAHCAIKLVMDRLPVTLEKQPILVIGWGRIGKCLAKLLRDLGAEVTIAARKSTDQAMINTLGYTAISTSALTTDRYRVIFNTAPTMLCSQCGGVGLKIDLASKPGLGGTDVIWARGLPNLYAPESSGKLIADTVMRLLFSKEELL